MSPQLIEHFRNPRNVGVLDPPALTVEASNPICGDILRLSARLENDRITEARFKVRGCTASIAAGSALTELVVGRTLRELSARATVWVTKRGAASLALLVVARPGCRRGSRVGCAWFHPVFALAPPRIATQKFSHRVSFPVRSSVGMRGCSSP